MSYDLEVLDQLLRGDVPVPEIRQLFRGEDRFRETILTMLDSGDVCLVTDAGQRATEWQRTEMLEKGDDPALRLRLTSQGALRIA